MHGTELPDKELPAVLPNSALAEEHRPPRGQSDQASDQKDEKRNNRANKHRKYDIEDTLAKLILPRLGR
jgi:hypothetical protein